MDFWPLIGIACLDALGVAAVWLVSYGLIGAWFPGSDEQARLAAAVLSGIFYWRLYMLAFRIFFRPGLSAARLVEARRCRRMGRVLATVGRHRVDHRAEDRLSHSDRHQDTAGGDLGLAAVDELSRP